MKEADHPRHADSCTHTNREQLRSLLVYWFSLTLWCHWHIQ